MNASVINNLIAGVDEAGRGPIAGPLTVAAVILNPRHEIKGLNDSKALSESTRDKLSEQIRHYALAWHIEFISHIEIDELNILQATLLGMQRSIEKIYQPGMIALIDGNRLPNKLPCAAQAIVRGDSSEPAIMAASIIAKVARDAYMQRLHHISPEYGFAQHKGYPTAAHLRALKHHGPCAEHRRSYRPVMLATTQSST